MSDNNTDSSSMRMNDTLPQVLRLRLGKENVVQVCTMQERIVESFPLGHIYQVVPSDGSLEGRLVRDGVADVWPKSRLETALLRRIGLAAVIGN